MTKIVFVNDNANEWNAACGDFTATLPPGLSVHELQPNGADTFVFGPPELQYPHGTIIPTDGMTLVVYAKAIDGQPAVVFENTYQG